MSLDKFGVKVKGKGPSTAGKAPTKKSSSKNSSKKKGAKPRSTSKKQAATSSPISGATRHKFHLSCSSKCGYKRTIRKRALEAQDYICEKCHNKMKLVRTD